jgi:hypothetical protein
MSIVCETTKWEAESSELYVELPEDRPISEPDAVDDDATAPVYRELSAVDAAGIFPGVPLS